MKKSPSMPHRQSCSLLWPSIILAFTPFLAVAQNLAIINGSPIRLESYKALQASLAKQNLPKADGSVDVATQNLEAELKERIVRNKIVTTRAHQLGVIHSPEIQIRLLDAELEQLVKGNMINYMVTDPGFDDKLRLKYQAFIHNIGPREFNVSHISTQTQAQTQKIVELLAKGAPFKELAQRYSSDPGSKENGGNLGWIQPMSSDPAFAKTFTQLKAGQISAPVKTAYGWHIIQLNSVRKTLVPTFEQSKRTMIGRLMEDPAIRKTELQKWVNIQIPRSKNTPISNKEQAILESIMQFIQDKVPPEKLAATRLEFEQKYRLRRYLRTMAIANGTYQDPRYQFEQDEQNSKIYLFGLLQDYIARNPVMDSRFRDIYESNIAKFHKTEVKISHILVTTEIKAKEIINLLNQKQDFATLAKENTVDTSTRAENGSIGWVNPGFIAAEFKAALPSLNPGEYYPQPIKTQYGWHVLRLDETRPAKIPSYAEKRVSIASQFLMNDEQVKTLMKELIEKLIKSAVVQ